MTDKQTFIPLFRKLKHWEWFKNSQMVHLLVYLLMEAQRFPEDWQGIKLETGQLVTGLYAMHRDTGISIQTLRTCIKKLKSTGEITIKPTNKYSVITLCNYKYYVDLANGNKQTNKQLTINQQSTNNQLTTYNKGNKGNKENNGNTYTVSFMNFWNKYPKKVGKGAAFSSWKRVDVENHSAIYEALEKHKRQSQWKKEGGRYIPNPATWLNQRRWEDEVEEARKVVSFK